MRNCNLAGCFVSTNRRGCHWQSVWKYLLYQQFLEVLNLKPIDNERLTLEKVKCLYLQDKLKQARNLLNTISTNTRDDFFNRSVYLEYARLEKIEGTYEEAISKGLELLEKNNQLFVFKK